MDMKRALNGVAVTVKQSDLQKAFSGGYHVTSKWCCTSSILNSFFFNSSNYFFFIKLGTGTGVKTYSVECS
jgi:hypothetical protein